MLQGTGELTGNIHQTRLTQQLRGPLQLTLEAQLSDVLSKLAWQARAEVTAFDIAQLNAAWPALSSAVSSCWV